MSEWVSEWWFRVVDTLLQVPISTIIRGTAAMGTLELALNSAITDRTGVGHSCVSYYNHFIRRQRQILTFWRRNNFFEF